MTNPNPFPFPVYSHRLSLDIALKTNAEAAYVVADAMAEQWG